VSPEELAWAKMEVGVLRRQVAEADDEVRRVTALRDAWLERIGVLEGRIEAHEREA
jgi:hypothetical protein